MPMNLACAQSSCIAVFLINESLGQWADLEGVCMSAYQWFSKWTFGNVWKHLCFSKQEGGWWSLFQVYGKCWKTSHHTPKTNIILCVNYTLIIFFLKTWRMASHGKKPGMQLTAPQCTTKLCPLPGKVTRLNVPWCQGWDTLAQAPMALLETLYLHRFL